METVPLNIADKLETGKLNAVYLKRIWSATMLIKQGAIAQDRMRSESNFVTALFNALGIGLEPTYKYLYLESPSFDEFEDWIQANGNISTEMTSMFNSIVRGEFDTEQDNGIDQNVIDPVSMEAFERDGYVIIPEAISKDACELSCKAVYEFLGADQYDPSSWYMRHPAKQGIMVQLFNHEVLNKNRFSSRIRDAFKQLWQRNDLMVSMDRVSFNPPETVEHKFPGPRLHWDVSLKTPIPFGLQGLIYLSDTPANQGAFTLVPGFHHKIENWIGSLPPGSHPRKQDLSAPGPVPLSGKAGDLIIWHHALPHGSCPNTAKLPRIVQYVNYQPLDQEKQDQWI